MEPDSQLDAELARLPRVDLDPETAHAVRDAAMCRLARGRPRSRLERFEGQIVLGLATTQLIWALLRVYDLSGR